MPINLAKSCVFNMTGTILPANGSIPSFKRASAAYTPFIENRGYRLKEANIHEPRFLMNGGLLLEPGTTNLLKSPQNIGGDGWVVGSQVQINQDVELSMTGNYLADKISASAGGSVSSYSIYQTLTLKPGYYTLSLYLAKIAGQLGESDRVYVLGGDFLDGGNPNTNELDGLSLDSFWGTGQPFASDNYKFKRVVLQFSVGSTSPASVNGSTVNYANDVDLDDGEANLSGGTDVVTTEQLITIALSLGGGGATLAIAGMQLEAHPFPTSFIESTFGSASRASEFLVYPNSPFEGTVEGVLEAKNDWTCRFSIDDWEGDGKIFSAGDVKAEIIDSKLKVTCGAHVLEDSAYLGQGSQVVIRNKAEHSLRLYVDYELRDQVTFNVGQSFKAASGILDFSPVAVRVVRDFLVLNEAIDDEIAQIPQVNGVNVDLSVTPLKIPGMLNCLFLLDYRIPVSEGKGRFVFTPISLRAGEEAFIRFPYTRLFSDEITSDPGAPTTAAVAQYTVVDVRTPGDEAAVNGETITEWVIIDGIRFYGTAAAGDGTWLEKKQTAAGALATAIAAAINTGELVGIGMSYSAGETYITLAADVAGVGFTVSTSSGVGKQTTTPNGAVVGDLDVTFPAEFSLGRAFVLRDYREIGVVEIIAKNLGAGTVTVRCDPAPVYAQIKSGDILFQPNRETEIAPANYYADTLEDLTGVNVVAKAMDGFKVRNGSTRTVSPITPLIKVFF